MTDYTHTVWNMIPKEIKLEDRIAPFFHLNDLVKSDTALRKGITNSFDSPDHAKNLVLLTREILCPVRNRFNSITLNSVYRNQKVERALKGKPKSWISSSQHSKGQAADIEVFGVSNLQLADWIKKNLVFDQLILEFYNPKQGPNSGWVHVSFKDKGNRKEVLSYVKSKGGYKYVPGFVY